MATVISAGSQGILASKMATFLLRVQLLDGFNLIQSTADVTFDLVGSGGNNNKAVLNDKVYNTEPLVFNCNEGAKVLRVRVFDTVLRDTFVEIELTGAPAGGYEFTKSGTFTIPQNGLEISIV